MYTITLVCLYKKYTKSYYEDKKETYLPSAELSEVASDEGRELGRRVGSGVTLLGSAWTLKEPAWAPAEAFLVLIISTILLG